MRSRRLSVFGDLTITTALEVNGPLIPVPHPDFMALSQGGWTAIVSTEGEKFSIVDLGLVTTIELGSFSAGPSGGHMQQ